MSDLADTMIAQRLSQISGVGRVSVLGGMKPAVRVQADLARLAAYGISMEDLRIAIVGANVAGPKGALDGVAQQAALGLQRFNGVVYAVDAVQANNGIAIAAQHHHFGALGVDNHVDFVRQLKGLLDRGDGHRVGFARYRHFHAVYNRQR